MEGNNKYRIMGGINGCELVTASSEARASLFPYLSVDGFKEICENMGRQLEGVH